MARLATGSLEADIGGAFDRFGRMPPQVIGAGEIISLFFRGGFLAMTPGCRRAKASDRRRQ
jgi:hypothetical protein